MSKKPGPLRMFFGGIGRAITLLRNVALNLLFLLLLLLFVAALLDGPSVEVPEGAALVLQPRGVIVEQQSYIDPLAGLLGGTLTSPAASETLLRDLLDAIDIAREDDAISALILRLDRMQASGFSKLRELGAAIDTFKSSGKKVYAIADAYSQNQYYLASFADEILLHPMGSVDLEGFSNYQVYFNTALRNLDVNMHIFRIGEFKSAVEPFERDDMSAAAREASLSWLSDLWAFYLADVGEQRGITPAQVEDYINNLAERLAEFDGDAARLALETGLVDRVDGRLALQRHLNAEIGAAAADRDYSQVGYRDYLQVRERPRRSGRDGSVGVIVASGTIYDGDQRPGNIGGDTLAALIRQARLDQRVQAVVLRIDSGGGSAFASEVIRHELLALKDAGKPLVVSMGSYAASGGYWIATPADEIWASPATLTGSIGIFALYPTFEDTLDQLGVHTDGVGTTDLAGAWTVGQPLPPQAAQVIQEILDNGYRQFLTIVAEGRDMSVAQVENLAGGRVWSGQQALERGLVDRLGRLDEAVGSAAAMASLEDYATVYIEPRLSPAEQFLMRLGENFSSGGLLPRPPAAGMGAGVSGFLQRLNQEMRQLLSWNDPRGLYVRCLECSVRF